MSANMIFRSMGHNIAQALSLVLNLKIHAALARFFRRVYWYSLRRRFRRVGEGSFIEYPAVTMGELYITIGRNFQSYARLRLEAYDTHLGHMFQPEIVIGDNVSMNYDCHIACINQINIGNNVLIASKVYITDHSHGSVDKKALAMPPALRILHSKGPVIIEDNVWIGEGVVIMPNVRIGKNSIIGANAVVTRDIPANCVAAGIPARVIKRLEDQ